MRHAILGTLLAATLSIVLGLTLVVAGVAIVGGVRDTEGCTCSAEVSAPGD